MHKTRCLGLVLWDEPEGWDGEGGSGWGTHVHPWWIHVNVWQNQYNIVKKINKTEKAKNERKRKQKHSPDQHPDHRVVKP